MDGVKVTSGRPERPFFEISINKLNKLNKLLKKRSIRFFLKYKMYKPGAYHFDFYF